ncbi:MAG: YkgJ family cysteine cluster protein [Betaproteobacteria bacterium]
MSMAADPLVKRSPPAGCGGCTVCCKFMKVSELDKPGDTWCIHCAIGSGCRIYDTRPESCRVYECVWLRTQSLDRPIAPELRPDRSRVVIGTANQGEDIILYVSEDRRDAWKRPDFLKLVNEFRARGIKVFVSCNDEVRPAVF